MITYKDLPIERGEKLKLTVTMNVTAPQAYALMEMFKCWTFYGKAGMSRRVAFYVDGDGDFHPNCECKTEPELPELPKDQAIKTLVEDEHGNCLYDFDALSWSFHPSNAG